MCACVCLSVCNCEVKKINTKCKDISQHTDFIEQNRFNSGRDKTHKSGNRTTQIENRVRWGNQIKTQMAERMKEG
jgi:hypothetical protein